MHLLSVLDRFLAFISALALGRLHAGAHTLVLICKTSALWCWGLLGAT
jgi:hypothetical protein